MEIKKIVFILPSLKTGGGNRVVIELANQLILDHISVDIIFPNNSEEKNTFSINNQINLISVGSFHKSKIQKFKNLLKVFKHINENYNNEIIIFTDPIMSIFIPMIKNNKIYRFIQADDYGIFDDLFILKNKIILKTYKLLTKISYNYKIKYIFNSRYTYNRFIKVSNNKNIKCNLVHPSLNHSVFFDQNIRDNDKINVCIIARKHPLKGFINFIEPINNKKIDGIDNVYVISHDDLSEFNLSNVIHITPKNDDEIAYYMNLSHIFISTSWWEGFGLPPLEAMACGCAVILSNAGGVNEYAQPDDNCLMFEPRNEKELIKKTKKLVLNRGLRNYLSLKAIERSKNFSWEKSKKQLLTILKKDKYEK